MNYWSKQEDALLERLCPAKPNESVRYDWMVIAAKFEAAKVSTLKRNKRALRNRLLRLRKIQQLNASGDSGKNRCVRCGAFKRGHGRCELRADD